MAACRCSNCDPIGSNILMNNQKYLTLENFDDVMNLDCSPATPIMDSQLDSSIIPPLKVALTVFECSTKDSIRQDPVMKELAQIIETSFDYIFFKYYGHSTDLTPRLLFPSDKAWCPDKNFSQLLEKLPVESIIQSEPIVGTYEMIFRCIAEWKQKRGLKPE